MGSFLVGPFGFDAQLAIHPTGYTAMAFATTLLALYLPLSTLAASVSYTIPSSIPSNAVSVDPSLVSVSIEFFAFPGYTELEATTNCLANIAALRGAQPAVRIGGTTQYVSPLLIISLLNLTNVPDIVRHMTPSSRLLSIILAIRQQMLPRVLPLALRSSHWRRR